MNFVLKFFFYFSFPYYASKNTYFYFILIVTVLFKGLKPPLLKRLYYLLVHLSSNPPIYYPRAGADSTFWDLKIGRFGVRVPFGDISSLSDVLFKELSQTFKRFLSALHGITASRDIGQANLHFDIEANAEQLNLLLRCCMVMLNLLVTDQYRLLRNGQILLDIQGELCSLNLVQGNEENTISIEKVSREFTYKGSDCATSLTEDIVASLHFVEPVDPCLPFLCSLLEVIDKSNFSSYFIHPDFL
ncbi:hypothetical protein Acr_21g0003480 [Actinidia rufa]|uniref:DUF7812 domain-containing protein n=1 Tax=Actinidia rufa TaxID=165716 RepID=A0A7J0GG15_9ERIC|nr:hypothetical protein Acr_21g0003480 [Actinidia rufa]